MYTAVYLCVSICQYGSVSLCVCEFVSVCGNRNCYFEILLPFVVMAGEPALVPAQSMAEALSLPADLSAPPHFWLADLFLLRALLFFMSSEAQKSKESASYASC